ncbi:endonuclease/exonuclease/phosphatase family protein [Coraliomargarita algicola]|uniref:Endonuclease/exonuclease/phosphatase family protein n=1 Tax=Coraliomargarita algicola TaxID=3092156 RepID=A0ABZ0RRK2_9BACT|nr:endonuclease/exonuclease/phosphatase family protein [Coraliomargarita sp. J2-16]WPJ97731.1 endonuclease/exonuclease/phosphatase family protein [Coraliomargarita sp. J2-16]
MSALLSATICWWPVYSGVAPLWYALLFFPKWWAGVLLVCAIPAIFYYGSRAIVVLMICAVLQVIYYSGMRFHPLAAQRSHSLSVMTLNAGQSLVDLASLKSFLLETSLDVIAFQELSQDVAVDQILMSPDWYFLRRGQLVVASRYPVEYVASLRRSEIVEAGGYGLVYLVVDVILPDRNLRLMNVHLDTPRGGLEPLLHLTLDLNGLRNNFRRRYHEASIVADDMRRLGVSLALGDFNMPYESPLYQCFLGNYGNAFDICGNGFGATKYTSWHSIRIDHVLHTSEMKSMRAEVEESLGSDHRPLLVDLVFYE